MFYLFRFQTLLNILFIVAETILRFSMVVLVAGNTCINGILIFVYNLWCHGQRVGESCPFLQSLLEAMSLKIKNIAKQIH
jgi:hypothetical protein